LPNATENAELVTIQLGWFVASQTSLFLGPEMALNAHRSFRIGPALRANIRSSVEGIPDRPDGGFASRIARPIASPAARKREHFAQHHPNDPMTLRPQGHASSAKE
jgi:hypothetical protein